MPGRRVDFVGVDVFRKSFVDGLVEAGEQVGHGFVRAAEQHGYGTLPVSSHGDAASGMEHADRDMAIANQISDVGQSDETRPELSATTLWSRLRFGLCPLGLRRCSKAVTPRCE